MILLIACLWSSWDYRLEPLHPILFEKGESRCSDLRKIKVLSELFTWEQQPCELLRPPFP
jgi:hypothetical protein